jgi:hypothetical protein
MTRVHSGLNMRLEGHCLDTLHGTNPGTSENASSRKRLWSSNVVGTGLSFTEPNGITQAPINGFEVTLDSLDHVPLASWFAVR